MNLFESFEKPFDLKRFSAGFYSFAQITQSRKAEWPVYRSEPFSCEFDWNRFGSGFLTKESHVFSIPRVFYLCKFFADDYNEEDSLKI